MTNLRTCLEPMSHFVVLAKPHPNIIYCYMYPINKTGLGLLELTSVYENSEVAAFQGEFCAVLI